ncbi:MAG: ISAs1 family transposase [Nostocoides sp.]
MTSTRSRLDEIVASFSTMEDPRSHINRRHPLPSVLVIAVLAVLAGAAGPTAIARWAECKADLLIGLLDLPYGIPGKDVFRRVLMMIEPEAFGDAFNAWIAHLRGEATAETCVDRPIIAIDGKTARRSHDAKNGLGTLHVVTAWAGELGLALGQQACAEKSNEITAIPELLKKIDVRGGIVTIDAMGTQKAIAEAVIGGKADYVLALKRNHETLHTAVITHIDERLEGDLEGAQELTTTARGHGREEKRIYLQLPAPESLPGKAGWKGLKSVGVVTSLRKEGEKESIEIRYYLSSLAVDVELFARAVRGHWSVENACHWSLDVTFREDDSRIRERVLGTNISWLYRFTLSILKQHPDRRLSLIMRRRLCGWSEKFLMTIINALVC